MEYNDAQVKPVCEETLLNCGPLRLHNDLSFRLPNSMQTCNEVYFSSRGSTEIINRMRPVLSIVSSYQDGKLVTEKKMFVCSQLVFRMFQEGYFFEAVSKASKILGKNFPDEERDLLDEIVAVAWADYTGAHSEFLRMLGVLN